MSDVKRVLNRLEFHVLWTMLSEEARLYCLDWLREEYRTLRNKKLSSKSIYNNWIALRSFFRWCYVEQLLPENISSEIPAPRFQSPPPDPFTKAQVQAILKACHDHGTWDHLRMRNYAIILVLLDTGIRNGELCGLRMCHLDLEIGRLTIRYAKYQKTRFVYLGKAVRKALWRYLVEREDRDDPAAPLFATHHGQPMILNTVTDLVKKLGKRAGISNCFPHRFRHTFAITYLRNGGDLFTLQRLLGHSSLDMVRRYVKLAEIDAETAHRRASPVDNWQL